MVEAHGSFDLQALDLTKTEEITEIDEDFEVIVDENDPARAKEPLPTVQSPYGKFIKNINFLINLIESYLDKVKASTVFAPISGQTVAPSNRRFGNHC